MIWGQNKVYPRIKNPGYAFADLIVSRCESRQLMNEKVFLLNL